MDESSMHLGMVETDITALKEALQAQQKLLLKLYTELDEEREASASAASEALSMILRLQREKAVVNMEASQYKRMAEEKMYHAEESLAFFEDVMYQKEMEIAALEFQVQAYRCKLLSMGCNDVGISETRSSDNLSLQRGEAYVGEMGVHGVDLEKKSENSAMGNFDSYWEQIRKLDERVKEISNCKGSGKGKSENLRDVSRSCSLHSQAIIGSLCHFMREHPGNLVGTETIGNSACSSSVHDIFEVPTIKNHKGCGRQKNEQGKFILEDENRLGKPESVLQEAVESHFETDWFKKMLCCTNNEEKALKPTNGVAVDCHLALVHHTVGVAESQAEIQQLTTRMEQLENERRTIRQEIGGGGEELELLKEIRAQLNSIQSEIRSCRTKKSPPQDESSVVSVMEAMLHFWL